MEYIAIVLSFLLDNLQNVHKLYHINTTEDTMDVLISLPEGKKYAAGCEVEFVLEEKLRFFHPCILQCPEPCHPSSNRF